MTRMYTKEVSDEDHMCRQLIHWHVLSCYSIYFICTYYTPAETTLIMFIHCSILNLSQSTSPFIPFTSCVVVVVVVVVMSPP